MNPTPSKIGIIKMNHYYTEIWEKQFQTLWTHTLLCECTTSKANDARSFHIKAKLKAEVCKTTDSLWLKTVFKVSWFWLRLATKRTKPYSLIWNRILLTMTALIYLIDRKYYCEALPPSFLLPTQHHCLCGYKYSSFTSVQSKKEFI